jgi:tetratricopeptide (TPR) repeat protein
MRPHRGAARQRLLLAAGGLLLLLLGPTATARRKGKKPPRRQQEQVAQGGAGGDDDDAADPQRLMQEADQAFARQDFAAAQHSLERALALAPADAMGQFKLGMLLSKGRQGRDAAVPHLSAAVELMPPPHPMRADTLGLLGRLELELAQAAPRAQRRRRLLSDGVLHARAAIALKPQAAAGGPPPDLRTLLEQAQQELDSLPALAADPLQLGDPDNEQEGGDGGGSGAPVHVFTSPELLAHLRQQAKEEQPSKELPPPPEDKVRNALVSKF